MANDDEKAQLYRMLIQQADPYLLIERMRALGFWPEGESIPDESPEAAKERARLVDELERLRNKGAKLDDPEAALRKERVRRWQESKKRRAVNKAKKETERAERAAAWEAKKQASLVHAGSRVSAGLQERQSDVERLAAQSLPLLHTPEELAAAMAIELSALRWLSFHRGTTTVAHYHRYSVPKKTGGERHISAPKPGLAAAQRWLFEHVLAKVAPTEYAHGFVASRSTLTCARPHVGRAVVINMDLEDFFPSVTFRRVKGLFVKLGYSESVATVMALLCTEPPRVEAALDGKLYRVAIGERRLPQGACTSPAITNLICRRLDRRLRGLAGHFGFTYTRYADDLTFSSDDTSRIGKLLGVVRKVLAEEGFAENESKTRIMRRGSAQTVTGLTVNDTVNLSRKKRRELRAILHNAARHGWRSQNRNDHPRFREYLQGWVAYLCMVDSERADYWRRALARALEKP